MFKTILVNGIEMLAMQDLGGGWYLAIVKNAEPQNINQPFVVLEDGSAWE